jgi:predicted DCC family thiol-disulfide oxidoreductase YuxK
VIVAPSPIATKPILLYNDECAVCRTIARWVQAYGSSAGREMRVDVKPIGDDPAALRALNPALGIWDAYETIHLLMPDGSMKTGGEAVAEVFRDLPNTRWFTWTLSIGVIGVRPFQAVLDLGYMLLSDVRPLFGCESCGTTNPAVATIRRTFARAMGLFGKKPHPSPHFTPAPPNG